MSDISIYHFKKNNFFTLTGNIKDYYFSFTWCFIWFIYDSLFMPQLNYFVAIIEVLLLTIGVMNIIFFKIDPPKSKLIIWNEELSLK